MPALPVMPFHPSATMTKPGGDAYGPEDREYWERYDRPFEHNGTVKMGMREHVHHAYPKMLFKAKDERQERDPFTGQDSFVRMTVGSANEHEALQRRDPSWCDSKALATEFLTKKRDDEAKHAAEAAHKAERMTEPAKRAYHRRSAASPEHAQE